MKILAQLHQVLIPSRKNHDRPHATRHHNVSIYSLLLLISHLYFGFASYSPIAISPEDVKNEIYVRINSERTLHYLGELSINPTLEKAAQAKLDHMFANNYWDHVSPGGIKAWKFLEDVGYTYETAGENLAKGFPEAKPMTEAWMNSLTHRQNILRPAYRETGVAVGNGFINGKVTTIAVQLFADPDPVQGTRELVAGTKVSVPELSLESPLTQEKLPIFILYLLLLGVLIIDGLMIRWRKEHHSKNTIFAFRISMVFNLLFFVILLINFGSIF